MARELKRGELEGSTVAPEHGHDDVYDDPGATNPPLRSWMELLALVPRGLWRLIRRQ
jgi:hypothetical protein